MVRPFFHQSLESIIFHLSIIQAVICECKLFIIKFQLIIMLLKKFQRRMIWFNIIKFSAGETLLDHAPYREIQACCMINTSITYHFCLAGYSTDTVSNWGYCLLYPLGNIWLKCIWMSHVITVVCLGHLMLHFFHYRAQHNCQCKWRD